MPPIKSKSQDAVASLLATLFIGVGSSAVLGGVIFWRDKFKAANNYLPAYAS
ncbi:MAG: hypothetical protein WBS33_03380 [Verrucomicrobiia bacterium]